jgi:peroxiredoxin (alkyl hydroperoxide reductase subunit C)
VIVGPDGVVRWSYEAPSPGELPSVELLREGVAAAGGGDAST